MKKETSHNNGDIVYLKTDKEQLPRIITAIKICGDGGIIYSMNQGTQETYHYDIEFSTERDILQSLT